MPQIDITQAQISLSELIEKAISGEEVVITKNDHAVVKLVAVGLSELIEKAISGEEVVITKNDHAVVKLVAVAPVNQRRSHLFGSDRDLISISDDFDEPLEDFQDYM